MNTDAYINSGLIELYVLGALTTEEAAEVEQLAAVEPEVQAAVQAATRLLSHYAVHFEESPPPAVRRSIRRRIDELTSAAGGAATAVDVGTKAAATLRYARVAMAASLGFIIVALLTAVNFYLRWQDAAEEAARLSEASAQVAPHDTGQPFSDGGELLQAIFTSNHALVPLLPQAGAPASTAWLSWEPGKAEVYVDLRKLPAPGEGESYQLWAFSEGQPVHLTALSWDDGVQPVPVEERFKAFSLSLGTAAALSPPDAASPHWSGQR